MSRWLVLLLGVLVGCSSLANPRFGEAPSKASPKARSYSHYLAGVVLRKTGRVGEAVEEMRRASDLAPGSLTLHAEMMETYIQLQDYENALLMCGRVLEEVPDNVAFLVRKGSILLRLGRHDEAIAALEEVVRLQPESPLGYQALISLNESTNDWVGALDVYRRLTELRPDAAPLEMQLGVTLARMNKTKEAQEALERALSLDPNLEEARFVLGLVYLQEGAHEQAVESLRRYLARSPKNGKATQNLAGALGRLGRYDEALSMLAEVLKHEEAEPTHFMERLYLLLRAGHYEELIDAPAPATAPLLTLLFQALALEEMDRPFGDVLDALARVQGDLDAECTSFLNELLFLFDENDAGPFLIARLTKLRAKGAQSEVVDLVLARVYMGLKRDAEAEEVLLGALRRYGPNMWTHYYLATVYEGMDRIGDTERHLKACIEIDPRNGEALNFLGYLYADKNINLDEAERLVRQALTLEPNNGYYLDSLGWVYYRKGNADRAIEYIRKAIIASESDDAVLRDHLGDAYLLKGDVTNALRQWERAQRLDPELEGVAKKVEKHKARRKGS